MGHVVRASFLQSNIILQEPKCTFGYLCVSNDAVFLSYLISSGFSISHFGFPWNFFSFHTKLLHNLKLTFCFANRDFQDGRRPRWVPLGLLSVIHVPFYHKFWKTKTPILPALLLKLLSSDSLRSLLTRPKSSIFMGRSWSFANTVKKNLLQISDGPTLFLWK